MMAPVDFLGRFIVPFIVSVLLMTDPDGDKSHVRLLDDLLKESDRIAHIAEETPSETEAYDFVIIGAGAGGAVVANRLSANGTYTVLLIESGGDPNPVSEIPLAEVTIWQESSSYVPFPGVRQEAACLKNDGICMMPRANALGGCTVVNGLLYNRGNRFDFERWATFTGDPIWSVPSVLESFRAIENYHGVYEDDPGPNHGTVGELWIEKMTNTPGLPEFSRACQEKGHFVGDIFSFDHDAGFSQLEYTTKRGLRQSTYHAFLEPILDRENLVIHRYSTATLIAINETMGRADGVYYNRHGVGKYVEARREVILSGGTYDSPKLLMLSGIGPRDHLTSVGIQTKIDLPAVGSYFQDHPVVALNEHRFSLNRPIGGLTPEEYMSPENMQEYAVNGTGPLFLFQATPGVFNIQIAQGYINSYQNPNRNHPDIHVYIFERLVEQGTIRVETMFFNLELALMEGTGTVRLASSNPRDWPLIDGQFLKDDSDVERMIDGISIMLDIFLNSPTFQGLGIGWELADPRVPECREPNMIWPSREYWRCLIRRDNSEKYHPTSTCRMGPNNTVAVVDSKLKVFGLSNLRVIDSSVMPWVTNGNTYLPTVMIGDMGAKIILGTV